MLFDSLGLNSKAETETSNRCHNLTDQFDVVKKSHYRPCLIILLPNQKSQNKGSQLRHYKVYTYA